MMSTRSADAKWLRSRSTRLRAEARADVRSGMLSQKYAPPTPRDKRIYPRNLFRKSLRAGLAWTRRRRARSVARGPVEAQIGRASCRERGEVQVVAVRV